MESYALGLVFISKSYDEQKLFYVNFKMFFVSCSETLRWTGNVTGCLFSYSQIPSFKKNGHLQRPVEEFCCSENMQFVCCSLCFQCLDEIVHNPNHFFILTSVKFIWMHTRKVSFCLINILVEVSDRVKVGTNSSVDFHYFFA